MDKGGWWTIVHSVAKGLTELKQPSTFYYYSYLFGLYLHFYYYESLGDLPNPGIEPESPAL